MIKSQFTKWWYHWVIWCISILILTILNSTGNIPSGADLVYIVYFVFSLILIYLINYFFLAPKLWQSETRGFYFISVVSLTILCTLLQPFIFDLSTIITPGYFFISILSFWEYFPYVAFFALLSFSLYNAEKWITHQFTLRRLVETERIQKETQLQALLSQVNPHFMLNGLNTMYGLALDKDEELPTIILHFSDILKYNLYLGSQNQIELSDELTLISKFIHFQKFRMEPEVEVKYIVQVADKSVKVSPYLILPFIENAFKHFAKNENDENYIHISITQNKGNLAFVFQNSHNMLLKHSSVNKGVGLSNIKERLHLNYPNKHTLSVLENNLFYQISLDVSL